MRRSWCLGIVSWSSLLLLNVAAAQDSGPGPASGIGSKQYDVVVLRMDGLAEGTLTFARTADDPQDSDPATGGTDQTDTSAGNDSGAGANPTATGDFGPVGSVNGTPTTSNTSGTTTGASTTTGSTEPASHWTRARANGRVTTSTNDPASSSYWTSARARGEVAPGDTNGGVGGGQTGSVVTTGTFTADFAAESASGIWYAVDLGNFSLWYASSESVDEGEFYAGYATPTTIAGRTSRGNGGLLEAIFRGSFFIGTAAESDSAN